MIEVDEDRALELVCRSLCQGAKIDPDTQVMTGHGPIKAWESMKPNAEMLIAGIKMVNQIYYD